MILPEFLRIWRGRFVGPSIQGRHGEVSMTDFDKFTVEITTKTGIHVVVEAAEPLDVLYLSKKVILALREWRDAELLVKMR